MFKLKKKKIELISGAVKTGSGQWERDMYDRSKLPHTQTHCQKLPVFIFSTFLVLHCKSTYNYSDSMSFPSIS